MTDVKEIQQVAEQLGAKFTEFKSQHEERYQLIEKELEEIAKVSKRPGASGAKATDIKGKSALRSYITKGDESGLLELQTKAMSVGSDADGGYAVPEYLDREVEKLEGDVSALVRLARTVDAQGPVFKKLVNLRGTSSGWVGETDARPETNTPKMAAIEIKVGELYANPKLTQHMIDDAMFDAENYVATEISEEFSDQLGAALINGDGVNKPKGILAQTITTEADGVRAFGSLQAVMSASAAGITFDDLKEMKRVLRAKYRPGAAWVMNDTTAMQLALIKDNNGDYIWSESVSTGQPDTLFGYPVEIDENMPDIAPGAYPVAFGNFQRGYYIARRKGLRLLRDPFTSKPWISMYCTSRVGGDVVNSEAIKLLQVAAA